MSKGGLSFFLALYAAAFLLLVGTPFGAFILMFYGVKLYLLMLGSLIIALFFSIAKINGSLKDSKLVDFVIFLPIITWAISGAVLIEQIESRGNFSLISLFWRNSPPLFIVGAVFLFLKIEKIRKQRREENKGDYKEELTIKN